MGSSEAERLQQPLSRVVNTSQKWGCRIESQETLLTTEGGKKKKKKKMLHKQKVGQLENTLP